MVTREIWRIPGWWEAECDAFWITMVWMFVWEHKQRLISDLCVIVDHKFFEAVLCLNIQVTKGKEIIVAVVT